MAKVIIEIRNGRVASVYAAPGTDVEVWDFDTLDEERPDEAEMRAIIAENSLVEVA